MIREHFQFRQTITTILADRQVDIEAAKVGMLDARQAVESVIASDPFFLSTFDPYDPGYDHPVIRRMVDAAYEADVGPMAAVAGTIAWAGAESMKKAGADLGVVDNGGDIALFSDRDLRIGIYAGTGSRNAFQLPPQEMIIGICTSSASIGPSISFGLADAVTVFSKDVSAADAWATALCNQLSPDDRSAFDSLMATHVIGVLALFGEVMISYGSVPEIIPAHVNPALITKGI
ncbi:UPF0280 family protein [Methanocalculus sp.]|uniref:UPF0280 family protein n=1 Tax=Methanocalculus sp. TaxID=2004547 RepID=UPI002724E6A4|nr:UPF0280 family protein [Methanocalculus sp.]MDO8842660.1 UPF0280 family protein [Methanocalculus sp.]